MGLEKIIGPKIEDTHAILSNGSCRHAPHRIGPLQKIRYWLNSLLINHFMQWHIVWKHRKKSHLKSGNIFLRTKWFFGPLVFHFGTVLLMLLWSFLAWKFKWDIILMIFKHCCEYHFRCRGQKESRANEIIIILRIFDYSQTSFKLMFV